MAVVLPFQGILYNRDKIKDIAQVLTPPYDVISASERDGFYLRHPHNVIRLDKARPEPGDTLVENHHTRAGSCFNAWLAEGVLVQDARPAFYLTAIDFKVEGRAMSRFGLIGRVKIEPFEKGVVLPHEKTFSKVKTERLSLMKASHANFSQIFSIFSDTGNSIGWLRDAAEGLLPEMACVDDAGHRHRLWRITDPAALENITRGFRDKTIFIADGHHRYETALNYQKWLKETGEAVSDTHPAGYVMMYLCAIEDPGLVILPTHRLATPVPEDQRRRFLKAAAAGFDIQTFSFDPADIAATLDQLKKAMTPPAGGHHFGVFMKDAREFFVLRLKSGVMEETFGHGIDPLLQDLDVTILTRLILGRCLGFTDAMLDDESRIHFTSSGEIAVTAVTSGTHDMAFMLNPTTSRQVRQVAENGLIMPRKSTYYYPKAVTGLVMRSLRHGYQG